MLICSPRILCCKQLTVGDRIKCEIACPVYHHSTSICKCPPSILAVKQGPPYASWKKNQKKINNLVILRLPSLTSSCRTFCRKQKAVEDCIEARLSVFYLTRSIVHLTTHPWITAVNKRMRWMVLKWKLSTTIYRTFSHILFVECPLLVFDMPSRVLAVNNRLVEENVSWETRILDCRHLSSKVQPLLVSLL